MVTLSDHNEVTGIHFTNMGNHAISATGADYSGAFLHHNTFSGHADEHIEDESGLIYAVSFDAADGAREGIRIEDSTFRDGEDLGAIRVFHSATSRGDYLFQRNEFFDLGGRAYFVRTQHQSHVETVILDSVANNIGRGQRNSDSIIPFLMGQSEQVMLVRNYRFDNTKQEGNLSNTAIEAFLFGQPFPGEADWCTRCRLTLKVLDSVIENAVSDPIQLTNAGRNSVLVYEIRNTRIFGGNPQQGGGGISLNVQFAPGSGGSTQLLVENSDVIGSAGYAFTFNSSLSDLLGMEAGGATSTAPEDRHTVVVDFGGGALGSLGHNRFVDNAKGAFRVPDSRITARRNWWGGSEPTVYDAENRPSRGEHVVVEPSLSSDPR